MEGVEETRGAGLFGPSFVLDAVTDQVFFAIIPGGGGRFGVVRVAVDVADFCVAFWVGNWDCGGGGGRGASERRRVRV